MRDAALVAALVTVAANALAALAGAWRWWAGGPSRVFWVAVRLGQAAAIALAVVAGVAGVSGFAPADGVFWVYAVRPVAGGFGVAQFPGGSGPRVVGARGAAAAPAAG